MPKYPEQRYRWVWELAAPPAALWPLVSNTDRFNRDCGYPKVVQLRRAESDPTGKRVTNARRLRAKALGMAIEWEELAFDWIEPTRFGVERTFFSGPLAKMLLTCELNALPAGGTSLVYDMRLSPANLLGRLILPFSIGKQARATTERVFRRYDEIALLGLRNSNLAQKPKLSSGSTARLDTIGRALCEEAKQPAALVDRLHEHITRADDLALSRIRPYALADEWKAPRRDALHLCLHATRAGLLDFSWDLVCPHCRGAQPGDSSLSTVKSVAHCDSCDVDFTVNFDQSVELTFRPNAAIRAVARPQYCVGGPQVTPHIVAQQRIAGGDRCALRLGLAEGRYRVRAAQLAEQHAFRVVEGGLPKLRVDLGATALQEPGVTTDGELTIVNGLASENIVMVERIAWSDQATTAVEVTSLQIFRDLFSREVLRPGEQISVGSMTIVFTDLKNSTQLYQEIGDAPAFGRVLTHFEILKVAVAREDGAIVKTMGDAIMAVFPRPLSAVRAVLHAQRWLARPSDFALPSDVSVPPTSLKPLALKAGIHCGPCLAINQNERLDYFGTTVNITARLCGLCSGTDIVLSDAVRADEEVAAEFNDANAGLFVSAEKARLKGFGAAEFKVWRVERQ